MASKAKRNTDNRVYAVTIRGRYYSVAGPHVTEEQEYEETFNIDDETILMNGVRSTFVKYFATTEYMTAKYPKFVGFATFHIKDCEAHDGEPIDNIELMNRDMLDEYIEEEELDINVNLYEEAEELRNAIRLLEADPSGYAVQEAKLSTIRRDSISIKNKIKELNKPATATTSKAKTAAPAATAKGAKGKIGI